MFNAIRSLTSKLPKPRQFHYVPRYRDKYEENDKERTLRLRKGAMFSREEGLANSIRPESIYTRKPTSKASTTRKSLYALAILANFYFIFKMSTSLTALIAGCSVLLLLMVLFIRENNKFEY